MTSDIEGRSDYSFNLELALVRLESKVDAIYEQAKSDHEQLTRQIGKHNETIFGNGHKGLTSRMDTLEGAAKLFLIVYTAVVTGIVGVLFANLNRIIG